MKPRLLVVDDDPELVDGLRDILEDAGYVVFTVSTGRDAVRELRRSPVDLMILDYNLPDGKGPLLAIEFREIQPMLRILLMTGMAERDMPPAPNIKGIIPKPSDPPTLLEIIRQALL